MQRDAGDSPTEVAGSRGGREGLQAGGGWLWSQMAGPWTQRGLWLLSLEPPEPGWLGRGLIRFAF